jgi:hypothetical protein
MFDPPSEQGLAGMSKHVRWIATCPECGAAEVLIAHVELRLGADGAAVEFMCPSCATARQQAVDGPTSELLQAFDARVVVAAPVAETVDRAPSPPP